MKNEENVENEKIKGGEWIDFPSPIISCIMLLIINCNSLLIFNC